MSKALVRLRNTEESGALSSAGKGEWKRQYIEYPLIWFKLRLIQDQKRWPKPEVNLLRNALSEKTASSVQKVAECRDIIETKPSNTRFVSKKRVNSAH